MKCGDIGINLGRNFTDLHTLSYQHILEQGGFSIEDARQAIEDIDLIRHLKPTGLQGDYHPALRRLYG